MATELTIAFDGTTDALREHRLSVRDFGPALVYLLAALRQSAKRMSRGAIVVDLELAKVDQGSTVPTFHVVARPRSGQVPLAFADPDLANKATQEVLASIQQRGHGSTPNRAVQKYLSALPKTVTTQGYTLTRGGQVMMAVEVKGSAEEEPGPDLPVLRTIQGSVYGVRFDPMPDAVEIEAAGKKYVCSANRNLVEKALSMRSQLVYATVVGLPGRWRLVALRAQPFVPQSPEERMASIFSRWSGLFARLAQ